MKNIWIICRKELRSYFVSPIAYLLLVMFAVIFGFFFWNSVGYYVNMAHGSADGGRTFADEHQRADRPTAAFQHQCDRAVFYSDDLRCACFPKRNARGTIELLATSPIKRLRDHCGKMAGRGSDVCDLMVSVSFLDFIFLFKYGNPDWKPLVIGYVGLILQAGGLLAIGTFISTLTKNQIIAGAATFGVCLMLWVLGWVSQYNDATVGAGAFLHVRGHAL